MFSLVHVPSICLLAIESYFVYALNTETAPPYYQMCPLILSICIQYCERGFHWILYYGCKGSFRRSIRGYIRPKFVQMRTHFRCLFWTLFFLLECIIQNFHRYIWQGLWVSYVSLFRYKLLVNCYCIKNVELNINLHNG